MKSITLFVLIGVVFADYYVHAEDLVALAHRNVKDCGKKFELSDDTISNLHQPKAIEMMHIDDNIKCFMKCLLDRSPITDDKGVLNMENYAEVMQSHGQNPNHARMYFAECSPLYTTADECTPLWRMFLCFNGMQY